MRPRHRFARAGILLARSRPDAERRSPHSAALADDYAGARQRSSVDGRSRKPQAEAIAIGGERIVAIGTTDEVKKQAGTAETVDLGGQFVVPGFVDSHVHFITAGFRLTSVQLRDAATPQEFARIGLAAPPCRRAPGAGGDWDHTLWGGELPRRDWIDAATPDHPVWVNRLDGHMALANSAALGAAGVIRM